MRALRLALALLLLPGCIALVDPNQGCDDPDAEPCGHGLVCDKARRICVPPETLDGGH